MCGIFGFSISENTQFNSSDLKSDISILYKLSEIRGVEAAGAAIKTTSSPVFIFKKPLPAFKMSQTKEFNKFYTETISNKKSGDRYNIIAHSRLVTNGLQANNINNQPVVGNFSVCVHNGIITNTQEIRKNHPDLDIQSELDSEILIKLFEKIILKSNDASTALNTLYSTIEGNANLAIITEKELNLTTNNGSLYYAVNGDNLVFTSEYTIMEDYINQSKLNLFSIKDIKKLEPHFLLTLINNKIELIDIKNDKKHRDATLNSSTLLIDDFDNRSLTRRDNLKRCSKCILPETMPFIEFDPKDGTCNYCKNYQKKELKGAKQLELDLEKYRRTDGKPELVFAFSGGRDSCYALDYFHDKLKMNVLAYSYDWGMITDLGRRNQSRMLGELGIEHVIISADIRKKRNNIRKNVEAWLKKPELGMIPLFIAGDKQVFQHAENVRKRYGLGHVIFSANYLEQTDFKSGFAGVNRIGKKGLSYQISSLNKLSMLSFYMKNFITNPKYINSSIADTVDAFITYYGKSYEYIDFFDYMEWDEKTVNDTIISKYNWETSPDTSTTWRIGDGTAAFYNYIYYTVVGFNENDTFRSNQIREGVISREEALRLVKIENQPRWDTIKEYCNLIQVDFVRAIEIIDNIPKHY